MGLPGKPKGFDGGEVERSFREGKIKEVADYCGSDVVGTYRVWLRECSRLRVANKFTWLRPGARVRALLPRTPNRISSVTLRK